ncbi:hypothetical protein HYQ46_008857 [Verticillium longisporum]|nr:hypothetical protein HYQ46_008857 [Verticillium longisporum]
MSSRHLVDMDAWCSGPPRPFSLAYSWIERYIVLPSFSIVDVFMKRVRSHPGTLASKPMCSSSNHFLYSASDSADFRVVSLTTSWMPSASSSVSSSIGRKLGAVFSETTSKKYLLTSTWAMVSASRGDRLARRVRYVGVSRWDMRVTS